MRNADVLGLGAVNLISKNPTAGFALRGHLLAAVMAGSAAGDAGDDYHLADGQVRNSGAESLDDADTFMADDAAWCT